MVADVFALIVVVVAVYLGAQVIYWDWQSRR